MPRRSARPTPEQTLDLATTTRDCPDCGRRLWAANKPQRTVVTLEGLVRLRLQVRSCRNPAPGLKRAETLRWMIWANVGFFDPMSRWVRNTAPYIQRGACFMVSTDRFRQVRDGTLG